MRTTAPKILVSDFDGTMTRHDFFDLALRDLPAAGEHDYWQDFVAGRLTHLAALQKIFAAIRTDWAGVNDVVARMELDPSLKDSVARLRAAGWEIIVASAGSEWYIQRLLAQAGVTLEVHANPGVFAPETGLVLSPPVASPYYSPATGIDKSAVVRAALARDPRAAFAGDGRPDLAPAQLVQPDRLYACGWLADHLRQSCAAFHPFATWSDIADHLLEHT